MSKPLYLRGVKAAEILNRYYNGEFAVRKNVGQNPSPVTPNQIQYHKNPQLYQNLQLNQYDPMKFSLINYLSGNQVIKNDNLNCMYCLRTITSIPVGIPIVREIKEENEQKIISYHCIDVFCVINCAYREYLDRRTNPIYSESSYLFFEIFEDIMHQNPKDLKPSRDKRYLRIYNGNLDYEQFHSSHAELSELPNNVVFYTPAEM